MKNIPTLESFVIQNGIVMTESLQKWRREKPLATLENLLLIHASEIREDLWLERWGMLSRADTLLPVSGFLPLADLSFESQLQEEQMNEGFAILQQNPFLRVAILHPNSIPRIQSILEPWIRGKEIDWRMVTPRALMNLFQEASSREIPEVADSAWAFEGQFQGWVRAPESRFGAVYETATHLWLVSPDEGDPWNPKARDLYFKETHFFRVSEKEWERLRCIPFLKDGGKESFLAPQVDAWSVNWSDHHVERSFFEDLLEHALERGASDIHLEPKRDFVRVRFRVNGELVVQPPIPLNCYPLLLRRAKVLSGMRPDRTPCHQDGAGDRILNGKRYDQRYSILLLKEDQECLVIRIFGSDLPKLDDLNLGERERETLDWYLGLESGMLVTCGPTGSGKTTTLYACLAALDSPQRRLVTVENPVEKYFENATQVDIREGKTSFAESLRTVLRQDPDVIMVGEMRDPESAEMAVHAALTGHLVLTTTHALDSAGVLERMTGSFHLDRVALGYSMKLSVAQRLVSVLCPYCKKEKALTEREAKRFGFEFKKNQLICTRGGCVRCHGTGIQKRRVVMEMMPMDGDFMDRWEGKASLREIRDWNRQRGFRSIQDQVKDLLLKGEVEVSEAQSY